MPKADFSETTVNFYTPVGSSLELTETRARQVDVALRELPEVQYTVTTINSGNAAGKIFASTYVRLVDRDQRQRGLNEMTVPLRERLARIPGITVTNIGTPDLGGGKSLQFSIQGSDLHELERLSKVITEQLHQVQGLVDLDSTLKAPTSRRWRSTSSGTRRRTSVSTSMRSPPRCVRWSPARRWATGARPTARTTT